MPTYLYVHTRLLKAQCIVCTLYLSVYICAKTPCANTAVRQNGRRQNVLIRETSSTMIFQI